MHAFLQVKFFWVKLSFAKPVSLFVITSALHYYYIKLFTSVIVVPLRATFEVW